MISVSMPESESRQFSRPRFSRKSSSSSPTEADELKSRGSPTKRTSVIVLGCLTFGLIVFMVGKSPESSNLRTDHAFSIAQENNAKTNLNVLNSASVDRRLDHPVAKVVVAGAEVIHVLIPSFRDSELCSKTILNAIERAKNPGRLRFHILDQRTREDQSTPTCVQFVENKQKESPGEAEWLKYKDFYDSVEFDAHKSCGPVPARAMLADRVQNLPGSDFVLGLDSHMVFFADWDTNVVTQFFATKNEKAVITSYPLSSDDPAFEKSGVPDKEDHVYMNGFIFSGKNPRFRTAGNLGKLSDKPLLQQGWAAGFNFARLHSWQIAGPDPALQGVFDGEEMHQYLRLWTHGYDTYSPNLDIMGHIYNRGGTSSSNRNTWYSNVCDRKSGQERLHRTFQKRPYEESEGIDPKYRLGPCRTLDQFEKWTGANFAELKESDNHMKEPLFLQKQGPVSSLC